MVQRKKGEPRSLLLSLTASASLVSTTPTVSTVTDQGRKGQRNISGGHRGSCGPEQMVWKDSKTPRRSNPPPDIQVMTVKRGGETGEKHSGLHPNPK